MTTTLPKTSESGSLLNFASPPGVTSDPLLITLEFHSETIWLRQHRDGMKSVRLVSADDITHAIMTRMPMTSGLMPDNALWWSSTADGASYGIWQPPARRKVALQLSPSDPALRYEIPMPGLVFVVHPGRVPWIFAAKRRPRKANDQLFRAPAFNVFNNGETCGGSHKYPDDPAAIPDSFFMSFFSQEVASEPVSKEHGTDMRTLWKELDGKRRYPLDDLMPHMKLEEAMKIDPRRRR